MWPEQQYIREPQVYEEILIISIAFDVHKLFYTHTICTRIHAWSLHKYITLTNAVSVLNPLSLVIKEL